MTTRAAGFEFASLKHRLLCMVYEAVLLFGVLFAAELAFDLSTQSLNQADLQNWHHLYLFVILGLYFTYFWGHGGQTLPMQTWHIRVMALNGTALTFRQACIRYCLAWMWFLPALAISSIFGIQRWPSIILLILGMCAWALTGKYDANGQFLHDRLAKTGLFAVPRGPVINDTD